ncbi:MAG: DNA-binding domain-containing protein [Rhizobiaceae bacterium]
MLELRNTWADVAPQFAAGLLDADVPAPGFLTSFTGQADPRRYAVYRNNVTVSLMRALAANFPSIERLVGDEFFAAMSRAFVTANPPRSRLLFEYGDAFPGFLETFEPVRAYPYLADVARLEQMWREAFHEADAAVLEGAAFAAVAPDAFLTLRLARHPAARILTSPFAAGSIFVANRQTGQPAAFDPAAGETILVTRPRFDCEVRILSAASAAFFHALFDGQTMETATEAAFACGPAFDLPASMAGLIASGAFTSILENQP